MSVWLVVAAGCSVTTDQGAFDLEADRTGALDRKGFPIFVGPQYDRDVPLKRTIERARLESDLQAQADARKTPGINVNQRSDQLLQQRLRQIARTHGEAARSEIQAACSTDADGVVSCEKQ